jgi:hypothetical protein
MKASLAWRRNDEVIDVVWAGHVSLDDVRRIDATLHRLLSLRRAHVLVADTGGVTGFMPAARAAAAPLMKTLRENGIELVVAVAPSLLVRLAGSAIALTARVQIEFVADAAAADVLVQRQLRRRRFVGTLAA